MTATLRAFPLGDTLWIKEFAARERTESGIYLPDEAVVPRYEGTVIAAGPQASAHVGERVIFPKYSGVDQTLDGEEFVVITQGDVIATVFESGDWAPGTIIDMALPPTSFARRLLPAPKHCVVRPYKPKGFKRVAGTNVDLYLERNEKHPPIWGWLLAVRADSPFAKTVSCGSLVIFKRFAEEYVGEDDAQKPLYDGQKLPIAIIRESEIEAFEYPPKVPVEY